MKHPVRHYIDGTWSDNPDSATSELHNPATRDVTGRVQLGGQADVDRAVAAARTAFESYSRTSVEERISLLQRVVAEFEKRAEDMTVAVTTDMGMPVANSRVTTGAAIFQFTDAIELLRRYPFQEQIGDHTVIKEPIGVAALIPPWNYPSMQMAEKVAPALAAGCTVVLKPSENVSHAGEVLAEIMHAAGVPAGVFNLVVGKGSVVGTALSKHPDVDMVAFTGSTEVGIQGSEGCCRHRQAREPGARRQVAPHRAPGCGHRPGREYGGERRHGQLGTDLRRPDPHPDPAGDAR